MYEKETTLDGMGRDVTIAAAGDGLGGEDETASCNDDFKNTKRRSKRACNKEANRTKYIDSGDSDDDDDNYDQQQQPPTKKTKLSLQRKTIPSYHGMKRKKLTELCVKEGLPCNGSDEEMKKRHSDYITLYNSECDAAYPRSVGELVKEIKSRESGRKVCCCCC